MSENLEAFLWFFVAWCGMTIWSLYTARTYRKKEEE